MAVTVDNAQIILKILTTLNAGMELSSALDQIAKDLTFTFSNGSGANQINMIWHDQRSVGSGGENLDLAGSLTSAFGATITFTSVKGVIIKAADANAANVQFSRPASNGVPLFAAASDQVNIRPGGLFVFISPDASGVAVTAGTGDILTVAAASGTVSYDIYILGTV